MDYEIIINSVLTLGSLSFIFGLGLAYVASKFGKEVDPRVYEVEKILPKKQCGICGFIDCADYAEAVITDPNVPANLCIPGKLEVAKLIAKITGKEIKEIKDVKAHIVCRGIPEKIFIYSGVEDCEAANLLFGGNRVCQYACLGLGSCVKACKFNAITMSKKGKPVINHKLCIGCGQCVLVCPKGTIELIPIKAKVKVTCRSHDEASVVEKICKVGCTGCGICAEKQCPNKAIKIENFLAVIDHSKCIDCRNYKCLSNCPTGSIVQIGYELL